MQLLKRVEIWILLAVVAAGLAWVFLSSGSEEGEESGSSAAAVAAGQVPLKLHRSTLKRDYGNARLDLEVRVRNDGGQTLVMESPQVKLVTGTGREVPSFFLITNPPPEIPAKTTQDVQLRYWLETKDLEGTLTLEVEGKKAEVKGGGKFDLESLKNGEEKVMPVGAW